MKRGKGSEPLAFKIAVESTTDISGCYRPGLKALGVYSNKISVSDTSQLQGSVDIDSCTSKKYTTENRWDYVLAYKSEVYFVEVHGAKTDEVRTIIRKLQWLKNWLVKEAPEINKMKSKTKPYIWIQSNDFQILKSSPQYRQAILKGILPLKIFRVD